MLRDVPEGVKKIYIHTGNILNLNEVKKKAGQNPTDELIESLKIALKEEPRLDETGVYNVHGSEGAYGGGGGGCDKASLGELTTGVKLFVSPDGPPQAIVEAVEKRESSTLLRLSLYEPKGWQITRTNFSTANYPQSLKLKMASKRRNMFYQNKKQDTTEIVLPYLEVDAIDSLVLADPGGGLLSGMWRVLEDCSTAGQINRMGVSDVDTETFVQLYNSAKVSKRSQFRF
ncbi:hypothetical protein AAG570_007133 [Ranatra chinensis]|uniref:GCS light chain n=1 Tax=Ranatra chinensis TaxID=642074 RepID=A0ABD0XV00_9HEMI